MTTSSIELPVWLLSAALSVTTGAVAYVKGQASGDATIMARLEAVEKNNQELRADLKDTTRAIQSLTVNVASLATEMKNFNTNLRASD